MLSDVSSRSFQMESEILIGAWGVASTNFCDQQRAGEVDFFQKVMKPALLADARKQSVAALALLAGAKKATILYEQDSACLTKTVETC